MKLLLDMNLSPRWVPYLAAAGLEATHWSQVGRATATDREIMSFARDNGFMVLTHDLDFSAILAATQADSPSVIQIRSQTLDPEQIGSRVVAALKQMETELIAGALLTVDLQRTRVRLLPFHTAGR